MIPYPEQLNSFCSAEPELCNEVSALRNLQAILKWQHDLNGLDSVQQDEYSYDVLIPRGGRWLVFGVT